MWRKQKTDKSYSKLRNGLLLLLLLPVIVILGYFIYDRFGDSDFLPLPEKTSNLVFAEGFTSEEENTIKTEISRIESEDNIKLGDNKVDINTSLVLPEQSPAIGVYVLITTAKNGKQNITTEELSAHNIKVLAETDPQLRSSITTILGSQDSLISDISTLEDLGDLEIAVVPISSLDHRYKLLSISDKYYFDDYLSGAIFRHVSFSGEKATQLNAQKLLESPTSDNVLKINQTGVTALTRVMMTKLAQVNDPHYFSQKIGSFLANADITHVSNEVSFKDGCTVSYTVFCSDPRFIETLKASGVDLVEIAGNHNNDVGSSYNSSTIEQYRTLGWNVFGGGLNDIDAAKMYIADLKQSKVAFLGYNYPDSPNGKAISSVDAAGANRFDFAKIQTDIAAAKQQSNFVIVDVQFWECYSYPNGYVEFPECDKPIGEQESVFKKIVDLGADMVVGTQAHQPQTYEIYNNKPIYYGLGNLYFDQTQWPGTERGIILSHYFMDGKLLQTKLSPTRFDKALQTELMTTADAETLLKRLVDAN